MVGSESLALFHLLALSINEFWEWDSATMDVNTKNETAQLHSKRHQVTL